MTGAYGPEAKKGVLEFGLDFTDRMASEDARYGRYFLNVVRSQRGKEGEGTIEYMSVIDYRGTEPVEYVCRGISGTQLALGRNMFSVSTLHPGHFSASRASALDAKGNVSGKTYVVRTAGGRIAKLKFSGSRDNLSMNYTFLD